MLLALLQPGCRNHREDAEVPDFTSFFVLLHRPPSHYDPFQMSSHYTTLRILIVFAK